MVSGCQVDDIYLNVLPKLKAAYEKRKTERKGVGQRKWHL